jgi:hypothetical protein
LTDYDDLVRRSDDIIESYNIKSVKLFAETSENKYEIIKDLDNWDKAYLSILNVYENMDEKVVRKIIESESEDYSCINTFYYDKNDNLKVLIVEISYFNSICIEGVLNKNTRMYFDGKKEIYKKIIYENENGESVKNTEKCIDNYNCDITILYNFNDTPRSR